MAEYYKTAAYKILSAFGGPESIIEHTDGSYLVNQPHKWQFVIKDVYTNNENLVEDERLLNRLRASKLVHIKALYRVPTNESGAFSKGGLRDQDDLASATRFPAYHYCRHCHRLLQDQAWRKEWDDAADPMPKAILAPRCCRCYKEQKHGKRREGYETIQMSFVMAGKAGLLKDVPWPKFINAGLADEPQDSDEEMPQGPSFKKLDQDCCSAPALTYVRNGTALADARIRCTNPTCGKNASLANLAARNFLFEGTRYRIFSKNTNSLYYPVLINSLRLPVRRLLSAKYMQELRAKAHRPTLQRDILLSNFEDTYGKAPSEQEIEEILGQLNPDLSQQSELEYRSAEYRALLAVEDHTQDDKVGFKAKRMPVEGFQEIDHLIQLKRLSMTTAQVGFTRLEPASLDQLLSEDENSPSERPKLQYIRTDKNKTGYMQEYLPATLSAGEGIFISLNPEWVASQIDVQLSKQSERLKSLYAATRKAPFLSDWQITDTRAMPGLLLIHTLSHLLIKELEFSCGYPATSLRERLYAAPNMAGILIYAIAGSEGTYGGLVAQAESPRFAQIWSSALDSAKDCSSDPVCAHSTDQGVEGLNLAACFACALLPETSCEIFNALLDRGVVMDVSETP